MSRNTKHVVKRGKQHDMPAHHLLESYVDEYLTETGIASDKDTPYSAPRPVEPASSQIGA